MVHNKEHKEHCSSFADSIQLYLYKTGISIKCLKEVLQFCSTLYVFLSKYDQQQATSWGSQPVRPINFVYERVFSYLSVQFILIEVNY